MRYNINFLFTIFVAILLISSESKAQKDFSQDVLVDKIVAVVGDKIILKSEVEIQYNQGVQQGANAETYRCDVLDQLLLEKLLSTQAEIDSLVVNEEEVELELDNRFRYYLQMVGGEEQFEAAFGKSVLEFREELRPDVRELLLARSMQGEVLRGVKVTPSEVKEFFNEIPTDSLPYFNSEVQVAQLLVKPKVNKEEKEKTIKKLTEIREKIVNNEETFSAMAELHSQDPGSAVNGGILGFMKRGELVPEFEAVAYNLRKGEVSEIVETDFGFHIIKMIERRGNKINVQHILLKPYISSGDMAIVENLLDSLRTDVLEEKITFEEAVEKHSEDELSKTMGGLISSNSGSTYFEMDALDPDLYFAVDALKEGDISEPEAMTFPDGSKGVRLLKIVSRTEPHQANLKDDYSKIKTFAENQKQADIMNTWIEERSENTYINIDEDFGACEALSKWQ